MSGFRAYFDFESAGPEPRSITLSEEESNHLCGSLRAAEGDEADAFDLRGNIFKCRIARADKRRAQLEIIRRLPPAPREVEISLVQCLTKGRTFDDIIRQCVEIGAARVYPAVSQFCQSRPDAAEAAKKRAKWTAQVVEAVKQSSNLSGFEIAQVKPLAETLESLPEFELKIVASLEQGSKKIAEIFGSLDFAPQKIAVLIGPEGDLSPEEYRLAAALGFAPATLGANVLKSGTAAIFALAQAFACADAAALKK